MNLTRHCVQIHNKIPETSRLAGNSEGEWLKSKAKFLYLSLWLFVLFVILSMAKFTSHTRHIIRYDRSKRVVEDIIGGNLRGVEEAFPGRINVNQRFEAYRGHEVRGGTTALALAIDRNDKKDLSLTDKKMVKLFSYNWDNSTDTQKMRF